MSNLFGDDDIIEEIADITVDEIADDLENPKQITPRSNTELYGHEQIEKSFLREYNEGRLPHAIILSGASGIGKATLSFRIAKFLLAKNNVKDIDAESLYIPEANISFKKVVSAGHADLLVIEREYDEKTDKLKSEISVEAVRKIHPFLSKTSADGGWRVVIIDGAEALNRSSQNAILKVLEEAPKKAMIILTTSQAGKFLPTIKSRCRMINMSPLSDKIVSNLIDKHIGNISNQEKEALVKIANGSIGHALDFYKNNGAELYNNVMAIISELPNLNMVRIYELAENLAKPNAEILYNMTFSILKKFVENIVRNSARAIIVNEEITNIYPKEHFLNAWENISKLQNQIDIYNLDKKQAIIRAFLALQDIEYQEIRA